MQKIRNKGVAKGISGKGWTKVEAINANQNTNRE